MEEVKWIVLIIAIAVFLSIVIHKAMHCIKSVKSIELDKLKEELTHKEIMEQKRLNAKKEKEQALFDKETIKQEILKAFDDEFKKDIQKGIDKKIDAKLDATLAERIQSLEEQIKIIANTTKNQ